MEMKIRITDEQLVKQMDEVIKEEGFTSRNQFITYVISMYLTSENKFSFELFRLLCVKYAKKALTNRRKTQSIYYRKMRS